MKRAFSVIGMQFHQLFTLQFNKYGYTSGTAIINSFSLFSHILTPLLEGGCNFFRILPMALGFIVTRYVCVSMWTIFLTFQIDSFFRSLLIVNGVDKK